MDTSFENIDDLIARVLSGEAGEQELALIENWTNQSPDNKRYVEETKKLFIRIGDAKTTIPVNTAAAWEKLQDRMEQSEQQGTSTKIIPFNRQRTIFRAAASLILLAVLAVLLTYVFNSPETPPVVLASNQKVVEQKLPDGSVVTLNKNTELTYVTDNNKIRQVKLKGEAYFEVVHNEASPFEIEIEGVFVKDIGTAFNVKALPESDLIEVLVESGEVQFYTSKNKGLVLTKGEKAVYNKLTKQFEKAVPNPVENTMSYKSRLFVFKEANLRHLLNQVNEVYGSNIVLGDERLGNCKLTVMFSNQSISDITEIIAETLDLEVEDTGEKIILRGQPCNN
jgi:ferric-dicitrate binding protein FerR (iron transport regulator)